MAKRRFSAQESTINRDLVSVMRKMNASSLNVNKDLFTGKATITFDRNATRYSFRCDAYDDPLDNLRAAQLAITSLWNALEGYGVERDSEALDQAFSQFFLGFAATPDDTALLLGDGSEAWHDVLGVSPDADRAAIVNAFRALAKVHHPDVGGDAEMFKRVRAAYEEGIENR